ncbi:hypothetical protein HDU90_002548 [Geranomyces variabilis]|nr:hypothetical protein HDU90_002548 [Geranomyces variabilis]
MTGTPNTAPDNSSKPSYFTTRLLLTSNLLPAQQPFNSRVLADEEYLGCVRDDLDKKYYRQLKAMELALRATAHGSGDDKVTCKISMHVFQVVADDEEFPPIDLALAEKETGWTENKVAQIVRELIKAIGGKVKSQR